MLTLSSVSGLEYRDDGKDYEVDGIDDKLSTISNMDDEGDVYPLFKFTSTCIDDETSGLAGELRRRQSLRFPHFPSNPDGWLRSHR